MAGGQSLGHGSRDRLAPSFQQDHVAPDAVEAPDSLLGAKDAEAESLQEPEAPRILRKHASLERPEPGPLRARDHPRQKLGADSLPARVGSDVRTDLRHAGVAGPWRDRQEGDPAVDP